MALQGNGLKMAAVIGGASDLMEGVHGDGRGLLRLLSPINKRKEGHCKSIGLMEIDTLMLGSCQMEICAHSEMPNIRPAA